ncbi:MAG: YaiI/YqxD family protein [Sumerlaeia bacterium]
MNTIFIDADACPVKNEIYKIAERFKLPVVVVANSPMRLPDEEWIDFVLVDKTSDAADNWIMEQVQANDFIITQDILLAERCIKEASAHAISPVGKLFTEANIGEAIASRELMERLRGWGMEQSGGPAPFQKADRSRFLHVFHALIEKVLREQNQR